jgi:hypothetical protein
MNAAAVSQRPDYGIDAPRVLLAIFLAGVGAEVAGFFGLPSLKGGPVVCEFGLAWNIMGSIFLVEALLWWMYVKHGNFLHRDRMLAQIPWTSHGLLLMSTKDLSGNAPEKTEANIVMEGVAGKCELRSEDVCKMSFADASFDVALSNLCVHNIPQESGLDRACREMARAPRPGGIAVISDYRLPKKYAALKFFVARKRA